MKTWILALAILGSAACSGDEAAPLPEEPATPVTIEIGGDRPARLVIPSDAGLGPLPLVLALHGYTSSADELDGYMGLTERVEEFDFALILANGLIDDNDDTFWEATDWCCGFAHPEPVDDVGYLASLVEEAREHVQVGRVTAFGHSNGGMMSYRLACDEAADISTVVSLAGTSYFDADKCGAARPISVLHVHGDADSVVKWEGDFFEDTGVGYSSVGEELGRWATLAGCDVAPADTLGGLDLESALPGDETVAARHSGCRDGIVIEVWRIRGGSHVPTFDPPLGEAVLTWLAQHS